MIPHGMFDSYRQYKNDTDLIANWLAKSAQACGYNLDASRKGKKKKKHHVADKVITIAQFVELATFLTNHSVASLAQSSCQDFLTKLDQVIAARDTHNAWYNAHIYRNEDAQITHTFFVDILRQVRDLLGPAFVARAPVNPISPAKITPLVNRTTSIENRKRATSNIKTDTFHTPPKKALHEVPQIHGHATPLLPRRTARPMELPPTPAPVLANKFAGLDVSESNDPPIPSDAFDSPATPSTSRSSSPYFKAEQVRDDQEVWLAVRCFFDDLAAIRDYTRAGLEAHAMDSSYDWITSVMTDAAVELVRRAEFEFREQFPEKDLVEAVRHLYDSYRHVKDQGRLVKPLAHGHFRYIDWAYVEPKMIPALTLLGEMKKFGSLWENDNGCNPNHYVSVLSNDTPAKEIFADQKAFVRSIYADLVLAAWYMPDLRNVDHLIQQLKKLIEGDDASISAAFALQTLLDVRKASGANIYKGWRGLHDAGLKIEQHIERSLAIHQMTVGHEKAHCSCGCFNHTFGMIDDYVLSDSIRKTQIELRLNPRDGTEHYLLKSHPTLAGNLFFKCQYQFVKDQMGWCNHTTAILRAMHLYNACLSEGFIKEEWPAMEEAIRIFTPKHLFVGSRPGKTDDYYRRLCLASGYSPRYFARDGCGCSKTPRGHFHSIRNMRGFKIGEVTPILTKIRERFEGNDRAVAEAMFLVEQRNMPQEMEVKYVDDAGKTVRRSTATNGDPYFAKQILLNNLCTVMHEERAVFEFDYLKLDRECWAMLDMLAEAMRSCFEDLEYHTTLKTIANDRMSLPIVVFPILSEVTMEKNETGCPECRKRYSTQGLKVLKEAAKVVEHAMKEFNGNKLHTLYKVEYCQAIKMMEETAAKEGVPLEGLKAWLMEWYKSHAKEHEKQANGKCGEKGTQTRKAGTTLNDDKDVEGEQKAGSVKTKKKNRKRKKKAGKGAATVSGETSDP